MTRYLYYWSGAKDPYYRFSNFFESKITFTSQDAPDAMRRLCPDLDAWLGNEGMEFASSEHLWQALKARDRETFVAFTSRGRFSDMPNFFAWVSVSPAEAATKCAHWGPKNMIGIVPKMAVNRKHAPYLDLIYPEALHKPRMTDEDYRLNYIDEGKLPAADEREIWLAILRAKFSQNQALKTLLLNTRGQLLIEFDRNAKARPAKTHWGGQWLEDQSRVVGANAMGEYLMAIRQELF